MGGRATLDHRYKTMLIAFSEIQTQGLGGNFGRARLVGLIADAPIA